MRSWRGTISRRSILGRGFQHGVDKMKRGERGGSLVAGFSMGVILGTEGRGNGRERGKDVGGCCFFAKQES